MSTPAVLLLLCTGILCRSPLQVPAVLGQPQPLVMRTMLRHQLNLASMGNRRYEVPSARGPEETTEPAKKTEAAMANLNVVHPKWPKKVNTKL